ncbi:hypothetical protein K474DRAFT_1768489 [Panus rudis PR-1116 ss-1]|nr:hypothetical protein K474DRAFT_1768489 [Panus rudis PR-1116 ss-1]
MLGDAGGQELSKLTVPQLRALCKERKLTGYSKLGKGALVETLSAVSGPVIDSIIGKADELVAPSNGAPAASNANEASKKKRPKKAKLAKVPAVQSAAKTIEIVEATTSGNSSNGANTSSTTLRASQSINQPRVGTSEPTQTSAPTTGNKNENIPIAPPLSTQVEASSKTPVPSHNENAPSIPTSRLKRPADAVMEGPEPKKARSAQRITPSIVTSGSNSTRQPGLRPETREASTYIPSTKLVSGVTGSTLSRSLAIGNVVDTTQNRSAASGKRFQPLVISKPILRPAAFAPSISLRKSQLVTGPSPASANDDSSSLTIRHLEFRPGPGAPVLQTITLPPNLAQRKRVQRWAIILSGLGPEERTACCLVSRMVRYAVYLSAHSILLRDFPGKRLQDVTRKHSPTMSNYWPYLRLRQAERAERRDVYQKSFLAAFCDLRGYKPISDALWSSGDNDKQITIAIRFALTRLWFSLSIGGKDHEAWLEDTVIDTQEIVPGEICRITVQDHNSSSLQRSFYVLEPTGEVVGHAPLPSRPTCSSSSPAILPLRADWSAYIQDRVSGAERSSLLESLKWANYEEYDRGISRLWLRRIAGEGRLGAAKRTVAERYVLACLVANSISGKWMSTTQMAQDFAGMPSKIDGTKSKAKNAAVNMYLPEHHHIESVHFLTAKGQPLHPAIAAVQTPYREYFVLKDNGMEIGSEEEGIREPWMNLLKCDSNGVQL